MIGAINKFKQPIKSEKTLKSIHTELLQIKDEISEVNLKLNNLEADTIINKILNDLPHNQETENYKFKPKEISKQVESFIEPLSKLGIHTFRLQSYHIPITLIINKNNVIHKITLFATGTNQNCIIEELIPNKYLDKGTI